MPMHRPCFLLGALNTTFCDELYHIAIYTHTIIMTKYMARNGKFIIENFTAL